MILLTTNQIHKISKMLKERKFKKDNTSLIRSISPLTLEGTLIKTCELHENEKHFWVFKDRSDGSYNCFNVSIRHIILKFRHFLFDESFYNILIKAHIYTF